MTVHDPTQLINFRTLIDDEIYVCELYNHNFQRLIELIIEVGEDKFEADVIQTVNLKKRALDRKLNAILND